MSDNQPNSEERWLPIPGYEGTYEASDRGRIRSVDRHTRTGHRRGKLLSPCVSNQRTGHKSVNLYSDGANKLRLVHRLVLLTFRGPCPDGMEGCHNNGVSSDNRLANLRWDTLSANRLDAVAHGTHFQSSKTACRYGHEYTPENLFVERSGGRRCRICHRAAKRRHDAKRRGRPSAPIWTAADAVETLEACREHVAEVGQMAVVR